MAELIWKILAYLPQYFLDLGRLCIAPKSFIAERDVNSNKTFADSLLFLGLSLVLGTLIGAPIDHLAGKELSSALGSITVLNSLAAILGALAICIAWRIVGGRARARGIFASFCYFSGVVFIIFAVFRVFALSVLKIFEPESLAKYLEPRAGSEEFSVRPKTF